MSERRVLVTGATGFVGQALVSALAAKGWRVVRAVRRNPGSGDVVVPDLADWQPAAAQLADIDCAIHLAARTHVARDTAADPLAAYRRLNVVATERLATACARAGMRRLVFLSSIKVNGEATGTPFTEQDVPHPEDAYGQSKLEAERILGEIAAASRLETVILRPPLIYGPGVKGNFLRLMRAIDRGIPLPLGAIDNKRSLIYLGNLVDAIVLCLDHAAAAGKTYLVADDKDVSTPELIRHIALALGKPARLIALPPALRKVAGAVFGKSDSLARLLGSLQSDSGRIRRELGWQPRCDMAQGLAATARWYHHQPDSKARI